LKLKESRKLEAFSMTKGILTGGIAALITVILYVVWKAVAFRGMAVSWDIRSLTPMVKFFAGMEIGIGIIGSVLIVGLYVIRTHMEHVAPRLPR
jgi:hypothetical protein